MLTGILYVRTGSLGNLIRTAIKDFSSTHIKLEEISRVRIPRSGQNDEVEADFHHLVMPELKNVLTSSSELAKAFDSGNLKDLRLLKIPGTWLKHEPVTNSAKDASGKSKQLSCVICLLLRLFFILENQVGSRFRLV